MITKDEIDRKADELGVHTANVQRDYVFGWLLAGLFRPDNSLAGRLVLKGGNCFRKAYFQSGRFSNDLDFSTQIDLAEEALLSSVKQACEYAGAQSGVDFLVDESRVGARELADSEATLYEVRVYFRSFYGEDDVTLKAKLDVLDFEQIFLPIQNRNLIHDYSDASLCQATLRCLKLEELLASKLKALLHRQHSPDLYDFVYSVFVQKVFSISRLEVVTTLLKKTIHESDPEAARGLLLELPFHVFRGFWNEYLVCPRSSQIDFERAESCFRTTIAEYFSLLEPRYAAAYGGRAAGVTYYASKYREVIMEAGRLQRMIRLRYDGIDREVEPYSLVYKRRRDGVGREYFYAWDPFGTGRSGLTGIKTYTPDKVATVQLSEKTFEPRFPIELTKGPGYFTRPFGSGTSQSPRRGVSRIVTGPCRQEYTVRCPYCGKTFRRSHYDTRLNKHKDKFGNRCYGRIGTIE